MMTKILPLLFLLNICAPRQLKAQVAAYAAMPEGGIWLDSGWRFSAADKQAFAQPAFDDRAWPLLSLSGVLADYPQLKKMRAGWLRLHIRVGGPIAGKALLLSIRQNCASEIYLDGKLIRRCGDLGTDASGVVAGNLIDPPLELRFAPGREHVIAIRFAPSALAFLYQRTAVFMRLNLKDIAQFNTLMDIIKNRFLIYGSLFVVFLLLTLLHVSFYRYNPGQRANLFFALNTGFISLGFLFATWETDIKNSGTYLLIDTLAVSFTLIGGIWIVIALQALFSQRRAKLVSVLWLVYLTCTVTTCFLLSGMTGYAFYLAGLIAPVLVQLWLTGEALKRRRRGAKIIVYGFALSLVAVLMTITVIVFRLPMADIWSNILLFIIFSAPATGISLYLAREFGLDGRLLQQKLWEVEELSAQNLRQEQEKQQMLESQNMALEWQVGQRTAELQESLEQLRETQTQLIQAEKMASLGELTAGIAHEIQNPLNFVNNFSEVSMELVAELKEEARAGHTTEVLAIAEDLSGNLDKIGHHGRRAGGIVKGMLEHSRSSTGQKEPTDLNKLAEECLRLAYDNFRSKDKGPEVEFLIHFEQGLPPLNLVPQDIGRVLTNLVNNACYAVKQKHAGAKDPYRPVIMLRTLLAENRMVITLKDNGTGIPDAIKKKIMQPFFTTKPAGQGLGLGLSLSYDIIVKGHGGEIEMDSKEGEYTAFVIYLPL